MKMTIYLPDDLGAQVKHRPDLNASAVCQDALRRELDRRAAPEGVPGGRPAKVELMGYRQHIGRVREVTFAGAQMLAVAALDGTDAVFPASSVYCITWLAEETLAVAAMPPELLAAGRECICPPGGSGVDELADCPVHGEGPF